MAEGANGEVGEQANRRTCSGRLCGMCSRVVSRVLAAPLVCLIWFSPAAACAEPASPRTTAAPKGVDSGVIDGAAYRIEFPEHWNGTLVLYAHGYEMAKTPRPPVTFQGPGSGAYRKEFLSRGAAFAESGYRAQGWAVKEALTDIEALRRYFVKKYGQPAHTYLNGHSMGGFLTVLTLERAPDAYDGGLALCGPYLPALTFMGDSLFPMLVTFDALFPGVLHLTANGALDLEAAPGPGTIAIGAAMRSAPDVAAKYAARFRLRPDEVPSTLWFYREILRELIARAGGNPFDNQGAIYAGFGDDAALNRHVGRYAAVPAARAYLIANATTNGRHADPILAVHTTDDPIVDPEYAFLYQAESAEAGTADLFVQRYVVASGHCAIAPPLVGAAYDDLVRWAEKKEKPAAGEQRPPAAAQ